MKTCPKCGTENPDTAKFCTECGIEIVEKKQEQSAAVSDEADSLAIDNGSKENGQKPESTFDYQSTEPAPNIKKKTRKNLIAVIVAAIILCLIVFFATHTKSTKSKYYIEPRKDYTITDSDFDFLDEETKNNIAKLLEVNIDWYNSIKYDIEKEVVKSEDVAFENIIEKWNLLTDDKVNLYNRKRLLAISPAIDGLSDFSTYTSDCEFEKNENGGANYIFSIPPDEWMHLHNQLQEALGFYYEGGDHVKMNNEPDTNYHVLTDDDDTNIRAEMVVQLLSKPLLANGDWRIEINQNSDGTVVIEYITKMIITKEEWLDEDDLQKGFTLKFGEVYVDTLHPVIDKYDGYFKDIKLIARISDSNDIPLVEVDKDKNILYRADLGSTITTSKISSDIEENYKKDSFGNISFEIPFDWEKEDMVIDSDSKDFMRGLNIYSPDGSDETSLIQITLTEVDWSLGVKSIIDTGIDGFENAHITTKKTTEIDGTKAYYVDYQSEYEGDALYQRTYIVPCSEDEVAIIILATTNKNWSTALEHFANSIHFVKELPDNLKKY